MPTSLPGQIRASKLGPHTTHRDATQAASSDTPCVWVWKQKGRVERGHRQVTAELGLNFFEGRRARVFHHHAAMVPLAYGFHLFESTPPRPESTDSGKSDTESPRSSTSVMTTTSTRASKSNEIAVPRARSDVSSDVRGNLALHRHYSNSATRHPTGLPAGRGNSVVLGDPTGAFE